MTIKALPIYQQDDRGVTYECGDWLYIARKAGTISANHEHAEQEILIVLDGELELTLGAEVQNITAPCEIYTFTYVS